MGKEGLMTPRANLRERIRVGLAPKPPAAPTETSKDGDGKGTVKRGEEVEDRIPAYFGIIITAVSTFFILYFFARGQSKFKPSAVWTKEELALYNGTDEKLPLLVAITGKLYDVTEKKDTYGVGKSYNHFCGRDATRAFASGNFSGSGLTDNVAGLSKEDLLAINHWRVFYNTSYPHVGVLIGRFYDVNGGPTEALDNLERRIQRAVAEDVREKAEAAKFPSCSSEWSPKKGGQVWCENADHFPRLVFKAGVPNAPTRCSCIPGSNLGDANLKEYANCDPRATRCIASAPTASEETDDDDDIL
eukprot:TRINITY_DN19056_c0_g1_i1.p1 TRINITY_DN19056_c0_g1~~TRINITY_DN19056_c0_g1_i1.p1  ORF type:complete len:303 (+),score=57.45 TRINITY_DN19056_c0_g1_i1:491-1399(+)